LIGGFPDAENKNRQNFIISVCLPDGAGISIPPDKIHSFHTNRKYMFNFLFMKVLCVNIQASRYFFAYSTRQRRSQPVSQMVKYN